MRKLNLKIKKNNVLLLAALFTFIATAVQAADASQFYGRISLGGSIPSGLSYEGDIRDASALAGRTVDVDLDPTAQAAVAFGFQPGGRTNQTQSRYELELAHRRYDTNGIDFATDTGGSLGVVTLFGNAYVDFNGIPMVQPYIGVGLGAAFIDQDIRYRPDSSTANVSMTDSDTVPAAQLMAGFSRSITNNLTVQADIKYLGTLDFESSLIGGTEDVGRINTSYSEASFNIGLRYAF